jgi:hypothetical protein
MDLEAVMIPSREHPVWKKIVIDDAQYRFRFLALKILMGRIKMKLEFERSDNVVESCVDELYDFACQYAEFIEPDLKPIMDEEKSL